MTVMIVEVLEILLRFGSHFNCTCYHFMFFGFCSPLSSCFIFLIALLSV